MGTMSRAVSGRLAAAQVCLLAADKATTAKERRRHLRRLACELRLLREARRRKEHPLTSVPGAGLRIGGGYVARLSSGEGAPRYWSGRRCKHGHDSPKFLSTRACCECNAMRARTNYRNDPEAAQAYGRAYDARHPEKVAQWTRRTVTANPYAAYAARANTYAKRAGAPGKLDSDDVRHAFDQAGNCCLACGRSTRLSIDHVRPLSMGGANSSTNIQILCVGCNARKSRKTIDYRNREAA